MSSLQGPVMSDIELNPPGHELCTYRRFSVVFMVRLTGYYQPFWQKFGKKEGITNLTICNPLIIFVEHTGVEPVTS
jgi:hypothetical protein